MLYKLTRAWYNANMKKFIVLTATLLLFAMMTALADEIIIVPDWAHDAFSFPDGMVKIESEAFSGDVSIGDVAIPAGVESIGQNAFAGCTGISRIVIFNSDVTLGTNALGTSEEKKTIFGYKDSTAEAYATAYGYDFELIYAITELGKEKTAKVLEYSFSLLAKKTKYSEMDCITFVRNCYYDAPFNGSKLKVLLPDTCPEAYRLDETREGRQLTIVRVDSVDDLQPGDVICWTDDKYWNNDKAKDEDKPVPKPGDANYKKCSHVGMYVSDSFSSPVYSGSHVFIESSQGYGGVRFNSFTDYYRRNFLCGWHIIL